MRLTTLLLTACILAACASSPDPVAVSPAAAGKLWYSVDNRAGLTPDELDALTQRLDADLAAVRVAPGTEGASQVRITITSYRMLHESGRAVVGMVSGTDHIASVVQRIDPSTKRLLDEDRVVTRATKSIGSAATLLGLHGQEVARVAVTGE